MANTIAIGSQNKTKIKAVESVFPRSKIIPVDAPSGVSLQPFGDEETKKGAYHRAVFAKDASQSTVGIGLEGGVMLVEKKLYVCNWGVLVDYDDNSYSASGARIELPSHFLGDLEARTELSILMDHYMNKTDIRQNEGAVGIFTNNLVDRASMFAHVVTLLKGQFEYWKNK